LDQGFAKAQYNLGMMYYSGQGVPMNHVAALKFFQRAGPSLSIPRPVAFLTYASGITE